ncbi:DUF2155 domain-containing protein [Pseudogemmobacter sonorensis]|uniref:DUF2155 domain-containing protein n=1 Tax=Pseudogemmobacter sonorensis TaxID=2989681 RepID=UPI0036B2135C
MIRAAVLSLGLAGFAGPLMAQGYADAQGGVIRWLDTLTGETGDVELARGQSATNGRLTILLNACRYPSENPASGAEAHLTILDSSRDAPVFAGWMLADSPALSAMEHPRYDVWVLRCVVPGYAPPVTEEAPAEEATEEDWGE